MKDDSAPALAAIGATLAYDRTVVFDRLDLEIRRGEVTTLIGANGCGKSTLLRAFGRLLTPSRGRVEIEGRPIGSLPTRAVARRLALLPQKPLTPSATSVSELVSRGRHPHQSLLRSWSADDARIVAQALAATGISDLAFLPWDLEPF